MPQRWDAGLATVQRPSHRTSHHPSAASSSTFHPTTTCRRKKIKQVFCLPVDLWSHRPLVLLEHASFTSARPLDCHSDAVLSPPPICKLQAINNLNLQDEAGPIYLAKYFQTKAILFQAPRLIACPEPLFCHLLIHDRPRSSRAYF